MSEALIAPEMAGTSLALVSTPLVPQVAYAPGGIEAILAEVKRKALAEAEELDISTSKGRAAIKSLAYKVATTKTGLDGLGKDFTDAMRQQMAGILADRSLVTKTLDALRDEIRKPVDDWEAEEAQRVADHEAALRQMSACAVFLHDPSVEDIDARCAELSAIFDRRWQEFAKRAERVHAETESSLSKRRAEVIAEAEALAEAARVAEETAEQERQAAAERQRQREEQIAAAAAERARLEAERRAEAERLAAEEQAAAERRKVEAEREEERRAARERQEAAEAQRRRIEAEARENEAKAAREQARLERERIAAEERAAAAERQREAEAAAAERRRQQAAEEAERAVERARQEEAARIREEAAKQQREAEARERNRAHKARIHGAAAGGLALAGLSDEQTAAVIQAIAAGQVPHVSIAY